MGAGYRVVLAGALAALLFTVFGLGWISHPILNNPQEERYQPYRSTADEPPQVEAPQEGRADTQSPKYRTPCDNPKGQTESDLCAQWKAANASEDNAFWTKWGFWVGVVASALLLWQIMLTRKAVEDTSEATEAMRAANVIAENAQRAWVRLGAVPKLARPTGLDGLYLRVEFTAENTGGSAATHFMLYHRIFFRPYAEHGDKLANEMMAEIDVWKREHDAPAKSSLLPKDMEIAADWKVFKADEVKWTDKAFVGPVAQPMLLAAAIYRTVFEPNVIQITWRTWYLASLDVEGQTNSYIHKRTEPLGTHELCADPYHMSASHEVWPGQKNAEEEAQQS